jgi:hypothetical protein
MGGLSGAGINIGSGEVTLKASPARHRYCYRRQIRPRCAAPIASHIALGSVLALLLQSLSLVRRQSGDAKLDRELWRLGKYIEEFKRFADAEVFRQFPRVTGFDVRTLARVYYCGGDPLTEPEIRELVRFEAKLNALQVPRQDGATEIAAHIAAGRLKPATLIQPDGTNRNWYPSAEASAMIEHAAKNLAELSQRLQSPSEDERKDDRDS